MSSSIFFPVSIFVPSFFLSLSSLLFSLDIYKILKSLTYPLTLPSPFIFAFSWPHSRQDRRARAHSLILRTPKTRSCDQPSTSALYTITDIVLTNIAGQTRRSRGSLSPGTYVASVPETHSRCLLQSPLLSLIAYTGCRGGANRVAITVQLRALQ